MHCEGCARKVRKCLKGFNGVEDVMTYCKTHKVVVKREKADPLKVLDRLQIRFIVKLSFFRLYHLNLLLKSLRNLRRKRPLNSQKSLVWCSRTKVHMHCEACSLEIKRRIERMKEVKEAIPDLKSSQVTIKGTFEPPNLVEYVHKHTEKHAIIVKEDPPLDNKAD